MLVVEVVVVVAGWAKLKKREGEHHARSWKWDARGDRGMRGAMMRKAKKGMRQSDDVRSERGMREAMMREAKEGGARQEARGKIPCAKRNVGGEGKHYVRKAGTVPGS